MNCGGSSIGKVTSGQISRIYMDYFSPAPSKMFGCASSTAAAAAVAVATIIIASSDALPSNASTPATPTDFLFEEPNVKPNRRPALSTEGPPTSPTNEDEERLVIDLFKGYNSLIRPSPCHNASIVYVEFGVSMILLINIDEKSQIMHTNIWLTLKWNDCNLVWNERDYGGIDSLRIPQERVWTPDLVLFNNADGNYEVAYKSNVFVDHLGNVTWVPPAIFKSSCRIDVEHFPFDQQTCQLIFGSWTYSADEVKLRWYNNKRAVELEDYSPSGVWDLLDAPGNLIANQSRVSFEIVIRRKSLFYSCILLIPTVLMAFLSMLVFYLPAECNEKVTLAISILLALVVFLLLVSKILPPTSDTIPLMARFLLMIFILNIFTLLSTVIVLNLYARSPTTHTLPASVRYLFLELLPRLLCMRRPERIPIYNGYFVEDYEVTELFDASLIMPSIAATVLPFSQLGRRRNQPANLDRHHPNCSRLKQMGINVPVPEEPEAAEGVVGEPNDNEGSTNEITGPAAASGSSAPLKRIKGIFSGHYTFGPSLDNCATTTEYRHEKRVSRELKSAVESIAFIAEHLKLEMGDKKIRDDWRFISMVVDRLLLLVFFGITLGGSIAILLSAPHIFDVVDESEVIRRLIMKSKESDL